MSHFESGIDNLGPVSPGWKAPSCSTNMTPETMLIGLLEWKRWQFSEKGDKLWVGQSFLSLSLTWCAPCPTLFGQKEFQVLSFDPLVFKTHTNEKKCFRGFMHIFLPLRMKL